MANPGPAVTISPHLLLQADSSDGYQIGTLSTTPIGMYGVSPVAQRSNANQLSVSSNAVGGTLIAMQTIGLSPAGVGINTTLSMNILVTGSPVATTGDFLVINKPTTQAGLGIANVRPQGATSNDITIQYFNLTGSTITPTAAELYAIANFRGLASSVALTPAVVAANSTAEQLFSVTGVSIGELLMLSKPSEQVGLGIAGMRVAGNNQIGITFMNVSTAPITPQAAEAYNYVATNGLSAGSNLMVYGVNVGTQLTPPVTTSTQSWAVTEQTITVSTILATDFVFGVSKPTAQGNFGIAGYRISAANTLALALGAGTVTGVTPTSSEIYNALIYRQAPLPPLTVLTATVAPVAIAGATTVEQAFSVTPVPTTAMVWVNKPSFTTGLGIVGCRVSGTGAVAITFANALTSVTVTPPSEVYTFGVIQPLPNGGSNCLMQVSQGQIGTQALANELRASLVNIGMITGGTP